MKMLSFERDGHEPRHSRSQQGKSSARTLDDSLSACLDSTGEQQSSDQPSNYEVLAPEKELHLCSLVKSQSWLYSGGSEEEISVKYHWESPRSRKRSINSSSPDNTTGDNLGLYFRDENNESEEDLETKCLLKEEEQMNSSSSSSSGGSDRDILKPAAQNAPNILRFSWFSGSNNGSRGSSITNKEHCDYDEEITGLLNDFDEIQTARHVAFDVDSFHIDKPDSDDNDQQLWALDSDDDKLSPPPPATKNTSALDMSLLCSGTTPWETDSVPFTEALSCNDFVRRHSEPSKKSNKYSMTQSRFMVRRKKKKRKPNPWDKSFAGGREFQNQLETVTEEGDEEKSLLRIPNTASTVSWGEDESKMNLLTAFEGCCFKPKPLEVSPKKHSGKKSPVPRLMAWMSRGKSSHKSTSNKANDHDGVEETSSDEWSDKPTEFVQLEEKPSSVSSFDTTSECTEAIEAFTTLKIGEASAFAPYDSITITSARVLEMMSQPGETGEI